MDLDRSSQTLWGNSASSISDTLRPNELKLSAPPSPSPSTSVNSPIQLSPPAGPLFSHLFHSSVLSTPRSTPLKCRPRKNRQTPPKKSKKLSSKNNKVVADSQQTQQNSLPLPSLIMSYTQVLFNSIIISFVLYFSIQFALTIKGDVQTKVAMEINRINAEIAHCQRQYQENRCHPDHRVPAMEAACTAWQTCIDGGPNSVGSLSTAKLAAETFADIINGLIEPISYKTLFFILSSLFGTIFLSNYALNMAKSRINYNIHHQQEPQQSSLKTLSRSTSMPHSYTLQLTPNHYPYNNNNKSSNNTKNNHSSTPLRIETRCHSSEEVDSSDSESIN